MGWKSGWVARLACSEANGVELAGEALDLALELGERCRRAVPEDLPEVRELGAARLLDLRHDVHGIADELADSRKVRLHEAPRGHRRRVDAEPAGVHRRLVTWDRVLVKHDGRCLADELRLIAVHTLRPQVDQQQMVGGADGNEVEIASLQGLGQGLRILHDLLLVLLELRTLPHLERRGQRRDRLVVRATLEAREHGCVDLFLEVILLAPAEENHGTSGPAQGLVGRGRHDVGVIERRSDHTTDNKAGDVGHVSKEDRTALVRNLAHSRIVDEPRISTRARNEDLRPDAEREFLALVVIDQTSRLVEAVRNRLEVLRYHGNLLRGQLVAVRQVATMRQVQSHDAVVDVAEGREDLEVGRAPAQGLNVDAPLLRVQPASLQSAIW